MKLIGKGRTSKVFSDGKFAYKAFDEKSRLEDIHYELRIQNEICNRTKLNLCEYTTTNQPRLIQMTLINGISLADRIRKEKYKLWLEDFIDLQMSIFQYQDLHIPSAFDVYEENIRSSNRPKKLKEAALKSLFSIDKKYVLCHLDFHPENIMYDGNDYIIIDWVNAKLANPIMDIARTYVIFRQYLKRQANRYLKLISKRIGISIETIKNAVPLMAFLRLGENDVQEIELILVDMILEKE